MSFYVEFEIKFQNDMISFVCLGRQNRYKIGEPNIGKGHFFLSKFPAVKLKKVKQNCTNFWCHMDLPSNSLKMAFRGHP